MQIPPKAKRPKGEHLGLPDYIAIQMSDRKCRITDAQAARYHEAMAGRTFKSLVPPDRGLGNAYPVEKPIDTQAGVSCGWMAEITRKDESNGTETEDCRPGR